MHVCTSCGDVVMVFRPKYEPNLQPFIDLCRRKLGLSQIGAPPLADSDAPSHG